MSSGQVALVHVGDGVVLSLHTAGMRSVRTPDGTVVSPPLAGWSYGDYALLPVVAHQPAPEGQHVAGVERSIIDGRVVETAIYEDTSPDPAPTELSRRQFKMQLAIAGLTDAVETWVASQDPLVQIAYAESGSFRREEPMMLAGFEALALTEEQIEMFFREASKL